MDRLPEAKMCQKYIAAMRENNEAMLLIDETEGTNTNGVQILFAEIDYLIAELDKAREDNARLREALRMISEDVGGGFNAVECAVDALLTKQLGEL